MFQVLLETSAEALEGMLGSGGGGGMVSQIEFGAQQERPPFGPWLNMAGFVTGR